MQFQCKLRRRVFFFYPVYWPAICRMFLWYRFMYPSLSCPPPPLKNILPILQPEAHFMFFRVSRRRRHGEFFLGVVARAVKDLWIWMTSRRRRHCEKRRRRWSRERWMRRNNILNTRRLQQKSYLIIWSRICSSSPLSCSLLLVSKRASFGSEIMCFHYSRL